MTTAQRRYRAKQYKRRLRANKRKQDKYTREARRIERAKHWRELVPYSHKYELEKKETCEREE